MSPTLEQTEAQELLQRASEAFPWFDANRLPAFIEAVQEAAFLASRIANANRPRELLAMDCERLFAVAVLDCLAAQVRAVVRD